MQPPTRTPPDIRDHDTLRLIGRGAFGEVWLARSVTGVLRAVKVVWREDYDRPESFEREFEALKRFEPISRRHEGLVPILQVGRNEQEGFYYYVMELADDVERGRDIDPDTYKPHTLGLQMKREKRVSAEQCIKLGITIAEGLDYLHRNQLIHRDVKPSNLIFIDGICRLADIGLVALLGQRSFVGTEGFVAPEGPGTAASDIFSLGMVLYEASTGKDRLDFPDLPTSSGTGAKLDVWRQLHDVICTACAPKAKERFVNAREMALALRGEPLPSSRKVLWTWVAAGSVVLFLAVGFGMWLAQSQRGRSIVATSPQEPRLRIVTTPPGAVVFAGEERLGVTPLELQPAEGVPVIYQLRLPGHKQVEIEHIASDATPAVFDLKMEPSRLPQKGERWRNSLGMEFKPGAGGHISADPVEMKFFRRFLEATGRSFEGKVVRYQPGKESAYLVVVPDGDAEAFRYWLTDRDRSEAFLSQEHHYQVEPFYFVESGQTATEDMPAETRDEDPDPDEEKNWRAFLLRVERQTYGSVIVRSQPEKVRVYQHEQLLGETPLELPRVRTGPVEFELREEGFADVVLEGEVREGEQSELFADMQTRKAVTFGRQWKTNSLGMNFVPLGEVMMSAWEIRHRDYAEYAKATQTRKPGRVEDSGKGGALPVVGVDRNEAQAFCAWLTERDRNAGLIGPKDVYRLPTDEEWSRAAGLPPERGITPAERNGRIRGVYSWGYDWPPPNDVDNLADINSARRASLDSAIPGYEDRFAFLAPVAALRPNERGISGLAGNVSEWVDTDYEAAPAAKPNEPARPVMGTTRGGNWRTSVPEELLASARTPVPPETRRNTIGFRVVLAHGK
ncbi:MAG: SUMF1/EgtB/PvdO family nonheme iron enzyme [Prosthecobacter sp.]|jgi:formylglycine-generating enzyme required for sulfatase activity|uniref:bifunctional serine/threonine-protein kinase/formylglycine-generating enzyme family protein n=1 Tax=Prosthecobacter sp. TaxID=1965333 RepID=UPI0019F18BAD|nr:bifunctional serine/threonine-protein kinase/formylglycine-generating enzyme family protein [Prosthecobacter sp.]MBE2285832.1 SUMF1/EgtB/PvdO family nonheme iron enzyme [Prosthecobacter sp.]